MEDIRLKFQESYKNNEITKLHEIIGRISKDYFLVKNYTHHDPAPLVSKEDKTVRFTSSSTNAVKPVILSGDYPQTNGFIVTQECLRNHSLEHAFNNDWLPFGQAYFHISGVLSKPNRFSELIEEISIFITDSLNIDPLEIIIRSTKKLDKLRNVDNHTFLDVEYDTRNERYYFWRFGIPNTHGEGITISVKNRVNNLYLDVGNIVRILDDRGSERGIEFGYGHEFLLSTLLNIENPLALSPVFELFPFHPDLSSKYYGYLEVIARVKKARVNPRNSGAGGIYRKYLRAFQYIGKSIGKDTNTMISEILRYCEHISAPTDISLERRLLEGYSSENEY